jgi:predicted transposase/invertase (TIGR01784 family)
MYDNTCRFLAEHFSSDFARWLLGTPVPLTEIKPSELSLEPIRADAMILLQSEDAILHLEFQTLPKQTIPFRMLDYRVRGHRRYPDKPMKQVVIYLKSTPSELVYQTRFTLENTHHEFQVMRLWEQPATLFLQSPGLLPFAALGQSENPAEMLRQATQVMDQIEDPATQANLMAASAILAGLRLEQTIVYNIVRRDIMQESVIYQSIQQEAEARGEARAEARKQREIAMNSLRAGLPLETVAHITGLSIEEVQALQHEMNEPTR